MGSALSTPDTAEHLVGSFVGDVSIPLSSDFWQKLLELPFDAELPSQRLHQACQLLVQNNRNTRHLAKILFHLACYLQESISTSGVLQLVYEKAVNAVYLTSVFLKHLIESAQDGDVELYLSLHDSESIPKNILRDQTIENLVMRNVLNFIASVDVSPNTYFLHLELLNFMIIAISTQLLCGPSPGPNDVNPFLDAAMAQDSHLVTSVVCNLLLNYITRPRVPFNRASYSIFYDRSQNSVLKRVGSAAANIVLLPFSYLISSSSEGSRNPIADSSLQVLLVLIHYHKCLVSEGYSVLKNQVSASSDSSPKDNTYFSDNPYCRALERAIDCELDCVDKEGNAHSDQHVKLPFAPLFDTLGMCLADETAVLLLYSFLQGNSTFLEYVLVRTDLDTLLMPILEALYDARRMTAYQIYMLLIILLILSQDTSFNAGIHKLILPTVPWYKERLLYQSSLGSLMVIILIRTIQYNLSKLRSAELQIYTDFLRLVLEIINAILTYVLPQNPEVVYAIMHKQEVFQPFKNHPRFDELVENIYTVLDFFNSRMDAQRMNGDWSVNLVLQVIIMNCRSWHADGMKMFTQLHFTYEQESHPEEFFIPYVWQLVLSRCGFEFNAGAIHLFPADLPTKKLDNGVVRNTFQNDDFD
ncbi:dymeclin-like isoform X4 [Glycine soja]|uniref:Dymeclin n=1 Tax=Glycine max TaxID=3847 RepID=A0A0R0HMD6_SOYBN|nr:dymeclin isoform X3 [Glycine max]XP_028185989.1 dymeclin-like isoform X4 [Glycine soja]|eukprot:XP_025979788.1 dymeclin isoform X4 [Glycine max]